MSASHIRRVLTGIKPTGSPHLGNYVGAIRPAIEASLRDGVQSYFFLADYHALIGSQDPSKVQRATLEIAASWLALGLDPNKVAFYRQSDVPEIPELNWLLSCVAAKGLLNRAHAYKAAVDKNQEAGEDADHGITAGLYGYPVLMAADILMFNAHEVPVGKDQVQHIEIARDLANRFNHLYGGDYFVLPEAIVDEHTAVLPGLDGRKMSKSYDNTIGLFLSPKAMKAAIAQIVTNSKLPGEPKDTADSALFPIYQAFASAEESTKLAADLQAGMAWSDVKNALFEKVESHVAPARARFDHLMQNPAEVEDILRAGGARLRNQAAPLMAKLREAVGIRNLNSLTPKAAAEMVKKLAKITSFKDSEGFRFKLVAADGKSVLLESIAFDDARACGVASGKLKSGAGMLRAIDLGAEWEADGAVLANGLYAVDQVQQGISELG